MINELKVGDKVVVVKENPNRWNFIEDMEKYLGGMFTVDSINVDCSYVKVKENTYSWDECFIDWEATSKLNKLSKLSATITVVNPLIKIKEIVGEHPFKAEYYSKEGFCVSLYDSEVDIIYCEGRLNLNTDVALTRDMVEDVLKVMKVIEENLDFFLLKED